MTLSIYLSISLFTLVFLIFLLKVENSLDRNDIEEPKNNLIFGFAGLAWPLVLPILILRVIILLTYKISAKILGKTN